MMLHDLLIDCKCLIFNDQNRLLLVREIEHWETPGGCLEDAESPIECVIREIEEELGAKVEMLDRLPIFFREKAKHKEETVDVLTIYFFGKLCTTPQIQTGRTAEEEEILKVGWFTSKEIRNLPLNKVEKKRLPLVLENLSSLSQSDLQL